MANSDSARSPSHAPKQGISAAELARRANVEPPAIRYWESQGWVIRYSDRTINCDATMAMVEANRSPANGGKPDRGVGAVKPPLPSSVKKIPPVEPETSDDASDEPQQPTTIADLIPPVSSGINAIKAFRERVKAEKELLELRQKLADLVPVATAERMFGAALASLIQNLENIPARVAPIFATMNNEFEIRTYLQNEIDKALHTIVIPDLTKAPQIEDPDDPDDEAAEPSKVTKATKSPSSKTKETKKRAGNPRMA